MTTLKRIFVTSTTLLFALSLALAAVILLSSTWGFAEEDAYALEAKLNAELAKRNSISEQYLRSTFFEYKDQLRNALMAPESNYQKIIPEFNKYYAESQKVAGSSASANNMYLWALRTGPRVSALFALNSGVEENYSVFEHTKMVLSLFENQQTNKCFAEELKVADAELKQKGILQRPLVDLMRVVLALHDIGKGVAVFMGDKDSEEIFSMVIAADYMKKFNEVITDANWHKFTEGELGLAVELIRTHQYIGKYLKATGTVPTGKLVEAFGASAKQVGAKAATFISLAKIVFIADAGSYPELRKSIFLPVSASERCLRPTSSLYKDILAPREEDVLNPTPVAPTPDGVAQSSANNTTPKAPVAAPAQAIVTQAATTEAATGSAQAAVAPKTEKTPAPPEAKADIKK